MSVSACGPGPAVPATNGPAPSAPGSAEANYWSAPRLDAVQRVADGRLLLTGRAAPGSRAHLARPGGAPMLLAVNGEGLWRATLPAAGDVRLYGLSMSQGRRSTQAEGYLAITPLGRAALLRSGSGAVAVAPGGARPRVLAVDFDRRGGAVISGMAAPRSVVTVSTDGVQRGRAPADAAGRFSLSLDEPLTPGPHIVAADGPAGGWRGAVEISPAPTPAGAPFGAARVGGGWRIDWMTPGGGVQSTVIFPDKAPGA
ncbi:MAG: hypothetical protein ABI376_07695 [Caulobacteraceae bacterium]